MNLPEVDDRRSRSVSRAILFACLLISIVWGTFLFYDGERAYEKSYSVAVERYQHGDFVGSSRALSRSLEYVRPDTTAIVILLRERATTEGHQGDYEAQLQLLLRARALADSAGLDSLFEESSESVGNVYAFCKQSNECKIQSAEESEARGRLPNPALLLLIGAGLIGLWYVFTQPR